MTADGHLVLMPGTPKTSPRCETWRQCLDDCCPRFRCPGTASWRVSWLCVGGDHAARVELLCDRCTDDAEQTAPIVRRAL